MCLSDHDDLKYVFRAGTVDTLADVCFRDRGIPGRPDLSEKTGKMETFSSVALHLRGTVGAGHLWIFAGYGIRLYGNGRNQ